MLGLSSEQCEQNKMVILLVEDDEQVRFFVCELLKSEGLTVLPASSGEAALAMFSNYSGSIDLLLTDFEMPGLNGIELCRIVASERPEIKVVVMSGDLEAKAQAEMFGLPFVQKPFERSAMREVLYQTGGGGLAG